MSFVGCAQSQHPLGFDKNRRLKGDRNACPLPSRQHQTPCTLHQNWFPIFRLRRCQMPPQPPEKPSGTLGRQWRSAPFDQTSQQALLCAMLGSHSTADSCRGNTVGPIQKSSWTSLPRAAIESSPFCKCLQSPHSAPHTSPNGAMQAAYPLVECISQTQSGSRAHGAPTTHRPT